MKTKAQIMAKSKDNLAEIEQYFRDVSHWNNTRGKTEGIIDPDPDGKMHRIADSLRTLIAQE